MLRARALAAAKSEHDGDMELIIKVAKKLFGCIPLYVRKKDGHLYRVVFEGELELVASEFFGRICFRYQGSNGESYWINSLESLGAILEKEQSLSKPRRFWGRIWGRIFYD